MSILIRGLDMPEKGEHKLSLFVCPDGTAFVEGTYRDYKGEPYEAVPVPPHGRLGDLDAVCYQLKKQETIDGQPRAIRRARRIVEGAETIIEAEEKWT